MHETTGQSEALGYFTGTRQYTLLIAFVFCHVHKRARLFTSGVVGWVSVPYKSCQIDLKGIRIMNTAVLYAYVQWQILNIVAPLITALG